MNLLQTTLYKQRRIVLFFLAVVLLAVSFSPASTTVAQAGASNVCAMPDNQVTGQANWAVAGLGSWSVVGLGSWSVVGLANWSVAGLGNWSVAGLGNWSVAGLGNWSVAGLSWTDLMALLNEIQNNTIDKDWIQGFLPEIGPAGSAFNTVPVALLVVDDFSDSLSHGGQVASVVSDLVQSINASLPAGSPVKIHGFAVDISGPSGSYELEGIVSAIEAKMTELENQGFKHFVHNYSFGALIPCEDSSIDIGSGETWDMFEFLDQSEGPQKIQPILECVSDKGNGLYTAHFGYNSFNLEAVHIPVGANNTFGSPKNQYQVSVFQPGRHKDMFRVDFDGSPITWSVTNGAYTATAMASAANTCAPDPVNTTATVMPLVTCVAMNPDPGAGEAPYRAYFGYFNDPENGAPVRIPVGENNRFSPAPWQDVGQTRVFEPGHVPFAFEVDFYGGQITWTVETLNGVRNATASFNGDTPICPFYPMFGDSLGLIQYLIMKGAPNEAFYEILTGLDDDAAALAPLTNLLKSYHDRSATDPLFRAVMMASSGNYARNYANPNAAPPLWPAQLDTTIAVAASLGSTDPNQAWLGSHLGNVMAPGAWYNIVDEGLDYSAFVSGTSYSAPHASVVAALWLTHPNACNFGSAEAPQRPLKTFAMDLTNDPFSAVDAVAPSGDGMPLDCAPNFPPDAQDDAAQTILDVSVTIDVLANDTNAVAVTNVSDPANGSATINADQTVTYDPNPNFPSEPGTTGIDGFAYEASDGYLTGTANVWVEVARLGLTQSCEAANVVFSVYNPATQLDNTPATNFDYLVDGVSQGSASVGAGETTTLALSFTPGTTVSIAVGSVTHDSFTAELNPCEPFIGYFFVVDSESNQVIDIYDPYDPIQNRQIIDLSVVPSHKINIIAVVEPSLLGGRTPAYVEFYVNGVLFSTETQACSDAEHGDYLYALAGHVNCDYNWWNLQPQTQVTLTAVPYDSDGNMGTSQTITFTPMEGRGKGKS